MYRPIGRMIAKMRVFVVLWRRVDAAVGGGRKDAFQRRRVPHQTGRHRPIDRRQNRRVGIIGRFVRQR